MRLLLFSLALSLGLALAQLAVHRKSVADFLDQAMRHQRLQSVVHCRLAGRGQCGPQLFKECLGGTEQFRSQVSKVI